MNVIGVTGSRRLTPEQAIAVRKCLVELMRYEVHRCHVGCAPGVDAIARDVTHVCSVLLVMHAVETYQKWALQARSKRMVDSLAKDNGILHAFLNKPCPAGVTVNSWAGSGTWGTVRYAIAKGVPVELHWLIEPCPLPDWLAGRQMSLL